MQAVQLQGVQRRKVGRGRSRVLHAGGLLVQLSGRGDAARVLPATVLADRLLGHILACRRPLLEAVHRTDGGQKQHRMERRETRSA